MDKKITNIEIIGFLREKKQFLKESFHVTSIALIGSYAKGVEKEDSDIDFLVEFDEVNFHNHAGLCIYLEESFKRKIDVVIRSPYLRKKFFERVQKDALYA